MKTSTYKTYRQCKENHPEDDVWYDDFHKCYQNTAYKGCSLGNITKCNPDDYEVKLGGINKLTRNKHKINDVLYCLWCAYEEHNRNNYGNEKIGCEEYILR